VVARHAWLFNRIGEELDWQKEGETDSAELRRAALREIKIEAGWNGVLALAEMVEFPEEAGSSYAELNSA